jgi:hypothetical protein
MRPKKVSKFSQKLFFSGSEISPHPVTLNQPDFLLFVFAFLWAQRRLRESSDVPNDNRSFSSSIVSSSQGDQIARIFAKSVIVYLRQFFLKLQKSAALIFGLLFSTVKYMN